MSVDPRASYWLKFVVALLIIVLIISGLGFYVQQQASSQLHDHVERSLTFQTASEADLMTGWISQNSEPVRILSDNSVFFENETTVQRHLESKRSEKLSDSVVDLHLVYTADVEILVSTHPDVVGEEPASTDDIGGFHYDSFDAVVVTDPYTNYRGNSVIAFVSPVPQHTNHALVMEVNVEEMGDRFHEPIEGGFTKVVGSDGTILFSENESEQLQSYIPHGPNPPSVRAGLVGEAGFETDPEINQHRDDSYVVAYAPVSGTDWVVLKHAPVDAAYAIEQDITNALILFVAIALLGVVVIGGTVGRNTATAIKRLESRAKAIEDGRFDVDLSSTRSDEIGSLYKAFSSMRDSLADHIQELDQAREDAEQSRQEAERLAEQLRIKKQQSDEQFRTLFETAPDPVVVVSTDGTIENLNTEFERTLGYDADEIVGADFTSLAFEPEERVRELVSSLDPSVADEDFKSTHVFTFDRSDGEDLILELNADILADDSAVGWIGILRDVTDREMQRQELKLQNTRLEQFASIVSHDLRNPLAIAKGYLEQARAEYDPDGDGPLSEVAWAHEKMGRMIEDLLALAREGEMVAEVTTTDFHDVATVAWDSVETNAATLHIEDDPGTIEADAERLEQLLANLFRNARDHNEGAVEIRVGRLEEGFYVEDDGCGIPEDKREDIFEFGYTNSADGTGLGLAIVTQIAEAHEWHVRVTSSELDGARFEVIPQSRLDNREDTLENVN